MKRIPKAKRPKRVSLTPELKAYIRKTENYRAGREPIALMKKAPAKFARAVAGLSASQMRKRPARGKWSIIEILGHLS
ncbi:MAG TPA: DinB family protein, partial [Candidatus Binatia bacterium]|nr:DinB family protein [Candidatus Binatia bacterium]